MAPWVGRGVPPEPPERARQPERVRQFDQTFRATRHWLLFVAYSLIVLVSACSKREPSTAVAASSSAQVLRISQRNEPSDLDPATASLPDEFFIIRALSEGLVSPAPLSSTERVMPAAAERWEISADGLTYTFHLRLTAQWSNGERLTAQDFVDSYRRVLSPQTAAPKANLFYHVKNARAFATGQITDFNSVGFKAPDASTLVVTLEHPAPNFLLHAASGPWIPTNPRVVEKLGRDWTRPGNFVGNGPFTLSEWRAHQRIIVKKNSRYHSPARVHLDEIDFVAFDSGDTEDRAYRAGQIDITMAVPPTKLEPYARERPSELYRAALAETRHLTFNTKRPPLDDVRVRRALSLAIDRGKLVERLLKGGQLTASRFVPPALARPPNAPTAAAPRISSPEIEPANLADARRLLADAGFPRGENFPQLELSAWPVGAPVTEAIQQMWKTELGIDVSLVTREAKVHLANLRDGHYDIGFVTTILDLPDAADALQSFMTGAPDNFPHWSDSRYDEALAQASVVATADEQDSALRVAESRLLEEAAVAPLYFNVRNWLMSNRVQGWQYDALWTRFYLDVYLDEK